MTMFYYIVLNLELVNLKEYIYIKTDNYCKALCFVIILPCIQMRAQPLMLKFFCSSQPIDLHKKIIHCLHFDASCSFFLMPETAKQEITEITAITEI